MNCIYLIILVLSKLAKSPAQVPRSEPPKIYNNATDKQFPFMVVLMDLNGHPECSGSLITDKLVLTAAQCILSGYKGRLKNCMAGELDGHQLYHDDRELSPSAQIRGIDSQTVHPKAEKYFEESDYTNYSIEYDLAVITVNESFNLSEHVSPIGIARMDYNKEERQGLGIGYGLVKPYESSNEKLIYGNLKTYVDHPFRNEHPTVYFTRDENKECSGDIGSPFYFDNKIIGVGLNVIGEYYTYANVFAELEWIEQIRSKAGMASESGMPSKPATPSESKIPSESGTPSKPATPSKSGMPSESGTPSEPATLSESGMASESGMPTKPAKPSKSGMLSKLATPSESGTPSKPATPSKSGMPSESGTPSEPATLSESKIPSESGMPTKPAKPSKSGMLSKLATPSESGTPSKPATPSKSGMPSESGTPSEPATLSESKIPSESGTPSKPATPSKSGMPSESGTPSEPATLSESGMASESGTPTKPAMPSKSGMLSKPATPSESKIPSESGTPSEPATLSESGMPSESGMQSEPGTPSESGMPSKPGMQSNQRRQNRLRSNDSRSMAAKLQRRRQSPICQFNGQLTIKIGKILWSGVQMLQFLRLPYSISNC